MPWELEIHLLDVGQGDSTLIVARDTAPGGQSRSMLVDAGLAVYGEVVHTCIAHTANLNRLDHIVSTHYDVDHLAGLRTLLLADDLTNLTSMLALYAPISAELGDNRPEQVASAVAAVCSTALGSYGRYAERVHNVAYAARRLVPATDTDDEAVAEGLRAADQFA